MPLHINTVSQAHIASLLDPTIVTLSPTTGNRNECGRGKLLWMAETVFKRNEIHELFGWNSMAWWISVPALWTWSRLVYGLAGALWVCELLSPIWSDFLLGTYHGTSKRYLQDYLNEFCYRFNRRFWEAEIPNRLIRLCLQHRPVLSRGTVT